MTVKSRIMRLERQFGINQEKLIVILEKFVPVNGEVEYAFDTAKAGGQTFHRQPKESKEVFQKRIAETVEQDHEGPVIVVDMGEVGEY